jgi:general secretion pathway protein G
MQQAAVPLRPSAEALASRASYTLVEMLVVLAILATLASIAVVNILPLFAEAKDKKAIDDIRSLEKLIVMFLAENGELPDSLEQIISPVPSDPWGNPYQYTRIEGGGKGKGKWRKDRFLVPINDDFDLYSMGPDGRSSPPLTAQHSRDDIVRGGNGGFIGVATDY